MTKRPSARAAAVLLAALTLVACGSGAKDKSAADVKDDISSQLQEGADGLDAADADCYADVIVDEVGADAVSDVDFAAQEPPSALGEKLVAAAKEAEERCDLGG